MVRFSKLLDYHSLAHYNLCRMLENISLHCYLIAQDSGLLYSLPLSQIPS